MAAEKTEKVPNCAFCRRSRREVRTLIAGPTVHICGQCVNLCVRILEQHAEDAMPAKNEVQRAAFDLRRLSRILDYLGRELEEPGLTLTPEVLARARDVAERTRAFVESLDVPKIPPKPRPKRKSN